MPEEPPLYLSLYDSGILEERVSALDGVLEACRLCPRECGVNRLAGELGYCGVAAAAKVASFAVHPWEEPPISGERGSGTIFFSGCTLGCIFCQNYPISQMGVGRTLTCSELADQMLRLQKRGVHNLNLVTSTHQMPAFTRALLAAIPRGLRLPIVYNSGGYESLETLKLLEGIVDIYLPDIKYATPEAAAFCSGVSDYVTHNRRALVEMWRQVGPLRMGASGVAYRGMMVRHLVLPDGLAGTRSGLEYLVKEMGASVHVSLMNQYFPAHGALNRPPLDRKIFPEEYGEAVRWLHELNVVNGYLQDDCEESLPESCFPKPSPQNE